MNLKENKDEELVTMVIRIPKYKKRNDKKISPKARKI